MILNIMSTELCWDILTIVYQKPQDGREIIDYRQSDTSKTRLYEMKGRGQQKISRNIQNLNKTEIYSTFHL